MSTPFNFDDLDSRISSNTARMEIDDKNNRAGREAIPAFMAQAIRERQNEQESAIKGMEEIQSRLQQHTNKQYGSFGLPTNQQFLDGFGSAPHVGRGGIPNTRSPVSEAQMAAEQKRKATAPTSLLHRKVMKELSSNVKTQVFGQDEVVDEIVSILKVACLGIRINKDKPAGCYFLAGPSGCGKTEMVLAITKFLSEEGRPIPFLKLNMGEFGMENDVTKLIGPPPGYNGNDKGGQLTNFVRQNPISIILFDEMEKAHESMDKIFLSILDKGVCSDGQGHEVLFKDTIIMVTSNLGAEIEYYENYSKEEKHEFRMEAIHENLRPEIVNRFDIIAQCNALPQDVYQKVMAKFLKDLYVNMNEVHGVTLTHSDALIEWAARVSYDPAMGGRPARKFIEKVMIKPLADSMIYEDVDFTVNKDLMIDLTDSENVCFKDRVTGKVLGEMKDTSAVVKHLQAGKFVKKGNKGSQASLEQAMSSLMGSGSDDNIVNVINEAQDATSAKPNAKVNRKSSRNDFAKG